MAGSWHEKRGVSIYSEPLRSRNNDSFGHLLNLSRFPLYLYDSYCNMISLVWFLLYLKRGQINFSGYAKNYHSKVLTLPILRLLLFKAQGCKDIWKPSKPCHVGIHWIALTQYSQMSTQIYARVSVIFQVLCILLYWNISHQQHKS